MLGEGGQCRTENSGGRGLRRTHVWGRPIPREEAPSIPREEAPFHPAAEEGPRPSCV